MDEVDAGQNQPGPRGAGVGADLRAAREALGLSLEDVGVRTRVPLRHLEAIEAGDYTALPSSTYAVGFARAYARAVGADEVAAAAGVRAEIDRVGRRQPEYVPYAMTDPARVPSRGVAIVAAGLALALVVLVALWYGGDWLQRSRADAPVAVPVATTRDVPPSPTPTAAPVAPTTGEVVLTAGDEVWMRVYDAANKTLYLGTLKPGERYVVPADANGPMINVGRPDKLAVTLNGAAVPPLGTGERAIKDVPVGAAAIAARLSGAPAPTVTPTPAATASTDAGNRNGDTGETMARVMRDRTSRAARRPRRVLTETQRANLQAAENLPPAAGNSR